LWSVIPLFCYILKLREEGKKNPEGAQSVFWRIMI